MPEHDRRETPAGGDFTLVEAAGSNRQIGRAVGEATREQVHAALAFYRDGFRELAGVEFAAALEQSASLLRIARDAEPLLVEELEGLAEGAGVPFPELFLLNCGEEFLCEAGPADPAAGVADPGGTAAGRTGPPRDRCTNVSIVGGGCVLGHNEDWVPDDAGRNVLFRLRVESGPTLLGMTAAGYLPATGCSSYGLAVGANTLYSTDTRVGVPNAFVCRSVLAARSIDDAAARACRPGRARGSNFHIVSAAGEIADVETSAAAVAARRVSTAADGGRAAPQAAWYAHTNHYREPALLPLEASDGRGSRLRLARAEALAAEGVSDGRSAAEIVFEVLRDHATAPYSICAHPAAELPVDEQVITCASQIWDFTAGVLSVCSGPPCENSYLRVPLP